MTSDSIFALAELFLELCGENIPISDENRGSIFKSKGKIPSMCLSVKIASLLYSARSFELLEAKF